MQELWLKFTDGDGHERRLKIDSTEFTVGRHSSNDLCIPDSRLSREHIKIERIGLVFFVSDSGSTNGTTLNGESLIASVKMKAGDRLNLGKGLEIEIAASEFEVVETTLAAGDASREDESAFTAEAPGAEQADALPPAHASSMASPGDTSGIPTSIFIIAPVLGLLILVFLGVIIFFVASGNSSRPPGNFVYTNDDPYNDGPSKRTVDDPPSNNSRPDKTPVDLPPSNNGAVGNTDPASTPTVKDPTTDSAKCEQNGAAFLRLIAQKEPKAFLTGEQAQIVSARVKQMSTSSAIADNINSARRSSAQIKALAASKNLKPQLLATAALTKLGTSRGDPFQTAQQMADTLDKLATQIGSELANDSLLMIAAYDQGAGGDFMKMRNMLQDLATKSPDSARTIRTIWFLHKNSKITDAEYDFALNFLAIGTITQNPKDFGVNAEALTL